MDISLNSSEIYCIPLFCWPSVSTLSQGLLGTGTATVCLVTYSRGISVATQCYYIHSLNYNTLSIISSITFH